MAVKTGKDHPVLVLPKRKKISAIGKKKTKVSKKKQALAKDDITRDIPADPILFEEEAKAASPEELLYMLKYAD